MEAVEIVEPAVTPLRYPEMRAEVIDAVTSLADPDYQQKVWIRREYPQPGFYDDLTTNINILFDDICVLPDPQTRVGIVLHPNEVDVMKALSDVLEPLVDELGDASDAQYLNHPQWARVVAAARHARQTLIQSDAAKS
ncbi:SCO4402 family protein [Saccharopolyspora dendranthemae]|uniref:Uncharacterized protein n=1 Tax=Saccharopolyspora dendranthemae TaxID=1181886 RepID=A0A561U282_9PSEU|nr:hypothetical protein [Saccharopolyspora dendranthemae]TWF93477.1 hypothetical protein FHU35_15321 [Saccharopolyspora dendranthemae]